MTPAYSATDALTDELRAFRRMGWTITLAVVAGIGAVVLMLPA